MCDSIIIWWPQALPKWKWQVPKWPFTGPLPTLPKFTPPPATSTAPSSFPDHSFESRTQCRDDVLKHLTTATWHDPRLLTVVGIQLINYHLNSRISAFLVSYCGVFILFFIIGG